MRTPQIAAGAVVVVALLAAAPSPGAVRPTVTVSPNAVTTGDPITVILKAPGGIAAAGRRVRLTIRQEVRGAACTAVASSTVKPNRRRSLARATVRPGGHAHWCPGSGHAEARVLDARGRQIGSPFAVAINIAQGPGEGVPVTVTALDGSTLTTPYGTYPVSGMLTGIVAGQVQLQSATTVDGLKGSLAVAGAPCSSADLTPAFSAMNLNSDGVVFATLHLDLHECGGPSALWLAGKVGDGGLTQLALDAFPGAVTAHLVVKVDLSGT